jgi:hypothetical protein
MKSIRRITLAILFLMAFVAGVNAQDSTCQVKIVVAARAWDGTGESQFGRMSNDQIQWWIKDGQKKYPKFCLVQTRDEADYSVVWMANQTTQTYYYTIPKTETTYHTGTVNGTTTQIGSSPTYTNGTYSGTSTTTTNETRQGEWPITFVNAAVYKVGGTNGVKVMPSFITRHKGQWRWSKPDKDAFQKSLEWINKQLK